MPVQPLVRPLSHYGNPRFQIPQQHYQRPLRPNRRTGQNSSDGNICKRASAGTLQGNDVWMAVYW